MIRKDIIVDTIDQLLVRSVEILSCCSGYASPLFSGCLWLAWLVILMVTVFGIVYRKGSDRAFWLGCCVFGCFFAVYSYFGQGKTAAVYLAIKPVYDAISWTEEVDSWTAQSHMQLGGRVSTGGRTATIYFPLELPFMQAAVALVGITVTVVGGLIAQWFHATCDTSEKPRAS